MKKDKLIVAAIVLGITGFLTVFFLNHDKKEPLRNLPYFDPKDYSGKKKEGHHSIPPFYFTDQYGKSVTEQTTAGKVYVADFFFTTCQSICPVMSNQLERVYQKFRNRSDFMILSHTVDAETDSVAQLLLYAKEHGVTDTKWLFVTGDQIKINHMARKAYVLTDDINGGDEDFVHTQNFALIDKEKHIRGYYDGTDTAEVSRLINDLSLLFAAYDYEEKNK